MRRAGMAGLAGLAGPAGLAGLLLGAPSQATEPPLSPIRVGRADAPPELSVSAQQEDSHLAARPSSSKGFAAPFE